MDFDWGGFGNLFSGLAGLGNFGMNLYGLFNHPQMPQAPQQMPFDFSKLVMPQFNFEFPDFSEMFAGMQPDRTPQMKNMMAAASSARKQMQASGVYSGGAVTQDALRSLYGQDDPSLFDEAWKLYGSQYGLT